MRGVQFAFNTVQTLGQFYLNFAPVDFQYFLSTRFEFRLIYCTVGKRGVCSEKHVQIGYILDPTYVVLFSLHAKFFRFSSV